MRHVQLYDVDGSIKTVDYDHPDYEPHTVAAIRKLIQPGWVCYDVGANIGYFTFMLAQLAGPSGLVVAFEPWPTARLCLTDSREKNQNEGQARVVVSSFGLSDKQEIARPVHRGNDWELLDGLGGAKIDLTTLDEYVGADPMQNLKPNFLKIDIDGYESRMLKGAQRVLRECKPVIVIELAEVAHEHHGQNVRDAIETLTSCGYHLYHEDTGEDLTAVSGSNADVLVKRYVPRGGSINVIGKPQ